MITTLNPSTTEPLILATAQVCYEMLGDYDAYTYADIVLGHAKSVDEILGYKVVSAVVGHWGLQTILFEVVGYVPANTSTDEARAIFEGVLAGIINDSLEVLAIGLPVNNPKDNS